MPRRKISRKLLVALVAAGTLLISDLAGVKLSPETQMAIVTVLGLWIGGEAAVDAADRIGKR